MEEKKDVQNPNVSINTISEKKTDKSSEKEIDILPEKSMFNLFKFISL